MESSNSIIYSTLHLLVSGISAISAGVVCLAAAIHIGRIKTITTDSTLIRQQIAIWFAIVACGYVALASTFGFAYIHNEPFISDWNYANLNSRIFIFLSRAFFCAWVISGSIWWSIASQLFYGGEYSLDQGEIREETTPRACCDFQSSLVAKIAFGFWLIFGCLEGLVSPRYGRAYFFHLIPITVVVLAAYNRKRSSHIPETEGETRLMTSNKYGMIIAGLILYSIAGILTAVNAVKCPDGQGIREPVQGDIQPFWIPCSGYAQHKFDMIYIGVQVFALLLVFVGFKYQFDLEAKNAGDGHEESIKIAKLVKQDSLPRGQFTLRMHEGEDLEGDEELFHEDSSTYRKNRRGISRSKQGSGERYRFSPGDIDEEIDSPEPVRVTKIKKKSKKNNSKKGFQLESIVNMRPVPLYYGDGLMAVSD